MVKTPLSIYIHVPFCTRKCDYCHFYVIPYQRRFVEQYLETLAFDIQQEEEKIQKHKIVSIYFGGGTPSLLSSQEIEKILSFFSLDHQTSIEITLEANPDSVSLEKMISLQKVGINRVSVGIQSFNDSELQQLSREHDSKRAKEAIWEIAAAGIENISIDLIYDLPHQTEILFQKSLKEALELPITHLSLYNLTIEPHTVFYKRRKQLSKEMPDEATSIRLLEIAERHLEDRGLKRYEISAFAKEGKEAIHNSGYWTDRPYLGFGPSAHSFYDGIRTCKHKHFQRWKKALNMEYSPYDFSEQLSPQAAAMEKLILGLRLYKGISLESRMKTEELFSLVEEGLVNLSENHATLTQKGRLFYDYVAERLVLI